MDMFLTALFTASLSMSAVILLLLLLNKLLFSRTSAAFRYYIWLIVLVGLLIPFRPSMPPSFESIQILSPFEAPNLFDMTGQGMTSKTGQTPVSASLDISGMAPTLFASAKPLSPYFFTLAAFGIWLTGALLVAAYHLRSYVKFSSSVRRWGVKVEDTRILSILKAAKDDMGFENKQIAAKTCALIASPILMGFGSPVILLPEREISSDELDCIFRHELTHYKRRDLWMNLLTLFVSSMHWFNPFVHIMAKIIRGNCEAACDEAVLAGSGADTRKHYGETIIGFVGAKHSNTPILTTYFYGGKNSMKKRLFSIMDMKQKNKALAVVCAVAVLTVTVLSGSALYTWAASHNSKQYAVESKVKQYAISKQDRETGFYKRPTSSAAITASAILTDSAIPAASPSKSGISNQSSSKVASGNTGQYIGEAKAKSIALSAAGLSESQVRKMKVKLDRENGAMVYEVEFKNGRMEYEYDIDATTGVIRKTDVDYDD